MTDGVGAISRSEVVIMPLAQDSGASRAARNSNVCQGVQGHGRDD
ncbi:MAG: hypothetical protein ACREVY_10325 [Gammaproteobacteria bacterium]